MMVNNHDYIYGIIGTALGSIGVGLSINELQAIISIVVTILGFTISVLIPLIIKLVMKIKKAKEDGVITKEEIQDIAETGKEIVKETESLVKEVSEKSEGDKKC